MTSNERRIEEELLERLRGLKYEHRTDIRSRAALEQNFREHFQALNHVELTDAEFARLLDEIVTGDVYTASQKLRETQGFARDDGTPLNYSILNTDEWCKNTFEVVNQLRINTDDSHHRYDVLLLMNGVPVVQIELKAQQFSHRRAMEQIVDYKNDPGNGYTRTLLCFVQLFVVSHGPDTRYFANNNARHFAFNADERFLPIYRHADQNNNPVSELHAFADAFLAKCTLAQLISKYMVLVASEQMLLVMRPYQIYAVKHIVDCIEKRNGNGYVWHTTGSGKTLTSFKASTLLRDNKAIEKCLFVVDRKDLDRQTREEFNRFQEGCVEENTNVYTLVRRLLSDDKSDKVIVTTIQKLGLALDDTNRRNTQLRDKGRATYKEQLAPLRDKRIVFIFDECHRSQFGDNHKAIKEFFPHAQLFGFTGTPIFPENATRKKITGEEQKLVTTEDVFQRCLHAYTITHAIDDQNVLKFHVDYFKPDAQDAAPAGQPPRKPAVVKAILDKHDTATGGRKFNAILATSSINDAIDYYNLFAAAQAGRKMTHPDFVSLNVAAVFSPPSSVLARGGDAKAAADVRQIEEDLVQESEDNKHDPEQKAEALSGIIDDYNGQFGTNHSINEFDLYYQDVQSRIKSQKFPNKDLPKKGGEKIDLTIVVDMLLTGFDSKYLNTLYVDKKLEYHNLIQAFSRTNRVLNGTKPYGNIRDFRGQKKAVDTAIVRFSGPDVANPREIWLVDKAPQVIQKLKKAKDELDQFMHKHGLTAQPEDVPKLKGDAARAGFIGAFKEVQRLQTQLDQYTDLTPPQEAEIEKLVPKAQLNGFRGVYLTLAQELKARQTKAGDNKGDADVDQLDFEFVLFASAVIDYDYIMKLIARYAGEPAKAWEGSREKLIAMIEANSNFLNDRELITKYVRTLEPRPGLDERTVIEDFDRFKAAEDAKEIADLAAAQGLAAESLQAFVDVILKRRIFVAEQLTDLLAPLELGWKARMQKELALMDKLVPLLKKRAGYREVSGLEGYEK